MKNLAPIVLFVYNRPWHTEQTLNALSKNDLSEQSILYIYADGAKFNATDEQIENIKKVRNIIRSKQWCKEVYIIESDKNKGLGNSIIDGVTNVINKHGKIIVLEDDMVSSPYFLKFMNKALDYYINEKKVWHISGWIYTINTKGLKDAFFWKTMDCSGGWATWEDRWKYFEKNVDKLIETFSKKDIYRFNLNNTARMWEQVISNKEGKINTWAIFWYATIFKNDGLCLSPAVSFVQNIGLDNSGVHSGNDKRLETKIVNKKEIDFSLIPIKENKLALKRVMVFYKKYKKPFFIVLIKKIHHKILSILKKILQKIPRRPIIFENISCTDPISRSFGFDRGTPIDRFYIDNFLTENRKYIHGRLLEIAENTYSKKYGTDVTAYEILNYDKSNNNTTIIGDLSDSDNLPDGIIDCFICTQKLNFIFDVQKAINGCYKLLKPNGVLLCTVSGISQISRYDMDRWRDYWRFTDLSIRRLFESVFDKKNIEITTYGNVLTANAFLQGLSIEDLPSKKILEKHDIDYQITIGIKAIK